MTLGLDDSGSVRGRRRTGCRRASQVERARRDQAEQCYAGAIELARVGGSTFVIGHRVALDDHEPSLFVDVAADHVPETTDHVSETSAVSAAVWNHAAPMMISDLDDETASRIRSEASCCARGRVLDVARQAIVP